MIDEVLYMQVRIFRMFCERTSIDPQVANRLFLQAGVWRYIAECFDILHLGGDELIGGSPIWTIALNMPAPIWCLPMGSKP